MVRFKKEEEQEDKKSEREKIEERREEVLARGRKFKYPLQYAKHKVVTLTLIISVFALVLFFGLGYVMLYQVKSTDDLIYRLTQILPVSVASVDGEDVRYSDYLLIYRSTIVPLEKQGSFDNAEDGEKMREHYKREALTLAEDYKYALKLARELGLSVSDEDVTKAVDNHRKAGGVERSEEAFTRVLKDNFGITLDEYRRMIYLSLVSEKVTEKIDSLAVGIADEVSGKLADGKNLSEIAKDLGDKVSLEKTGGPVDRMNIDGGRATVAFSLEKGQTSPRFISNSGDGYYFVTLVDKTESTVDYVSIQIPFNELKTRLEKIRGEDKVKEKITLEDSWSEEAIEEETSEE